MPDLKFVLMELGNKLVTQYGFMPATICPEFERSTLAVKEFTDWINRNPEAREALAELGYDWPMPNRGQREKP